MTAPSATVPPVPDPPVPGSPRIDAPPTAPHASAAPALPAGLAELVRSHRIVVCVGSGGVGKTTTAASLGLLAARQGRRTLVLTIDPARRLAAALGIEAFDRRRQQLPDLRLDQLGIEAGRFHATMLDQKRTFDDMVRRYAPSAEALQTLLQSRIYQQLSGRLAGSQEYAALEKLHQVRLEDAHDLLVLDTPPTQNALDFLEAPQKMVDAVESPAVSLLIRAYRRSGRLSLNMLGFGASYVMQRLARFTGADLLDDIARFLAELSGLLGGMRDRAAQVQQMLRSDELAFVLITSPDVRAVDEAVVMLDRLGASSMHLGGVVVNRVHTLAELTAGPDARLRALREAGLSAHDAEAAHDALSRSHARFAALAEGNRREIDRLRRRCPPGTPVVEVPLFEQDIFDVDGLKRLMETLAS